MTKYIVKNLVKDNEKVVYEGAINSWVLFPYIIGIIFFSFIVIYLGNLNINSNFIIFGMSILKFLQRFFLILDVSIFFLFLNKMIYIFFTELVITNKRVIFKTGLFNIDTKFIDFSKIESVDLNQSFLGRIFNFGNILIKGIGDSFLNIIEVSHPQKFIKYINI